MRPFDDSSLTPDERLSEVASILAAGVLRLCARTLPATDVPKHSAPENLAEPTSACLEVPRDTVLSVGALLKGILRCTPCGCAMSPTHSTKNGNKRYRYYVCTAAQKRGWHTCPSKSIPAGEIERFVVDQIKCIGRDPTLLHETIAQARSQGQTQVSALETERRGLERELARWNADVRALLQQIVPGEGNTPSTARLADLQERIHGAEQRAILIRQQVVALSRDIVDQREVAKAMAIFDPVWDSLAPREQVRAVQLLVERVDYDGATGKISITFHASGIKTLADELAGHNTEDAA